MAYDSSKPASDGFLAEFPPEMREQLRAIVNDAIVNAFKIQGLVPGNASGNLAVNNGNLCTNLNAEMLGSKTAGYFAADGHTHGAASGSTDGLLSSVDKVKLDSLQTGAEANQFAFGNVSVGNMTIQADHKTDTLELVAGANIGMTADAVNDRVTIAVAGKVASAVSADMAATLQTARTIGFSGAVIGTATSFNGSSNITVPVTALDVGAATTGILPVARGGTGTAAITGLLKGNGTNGFSAAVPGSDYVVPAGSITGNASTATKLAAVRTINGIAFDGTANISLTPAQVGAAAAIHSHTADDISGLSTSSQQIYMTAGVYEFIAPTNRVFVSLCGGGGGGGSGGAKSGTNGGGGGGGGGACGQYIEYAPVTVVPGAKISVTVGAGGSGGVSVYQSNGNSGATGGTSSFGSYVSAAGGGGGSGGGNSRSLGAGGVSPIRGLNGGNGGFGQGATSDQSPTAGMSSNGFNHGVGGAIPSNLAYGGGGGGGACWAQMVISGCAGSGGSGGNNSGNGANGEQATTHGAGGGGGGGAFSNKTSGAGGNGSTGFVLVKW